MNREQLHILLDKKAIAWMPTGSRYICDPAPTDTDEDYIAFMPKGMEQALELAGFVMGTDPALYQNLPDFFAFRLGEFNVVVTHSADFYKKFCAATNQAKAQNIQEKSARIALFQEVLYGKYSVEIPL
jgi:hypothetical protein